MKSAIRRCAFTAIAIFVESLRAQQPSGQWDFNNGDLSATVGQPLTYIDLPGGATQLGTQFGTTTSFGIPDIGGASAQVMRFPANTNLAMGYNMPTPATPNGGGGFVNDWTIVMDLLFTGASHGAWRGLMDIDGTLISEDAEFFINPSNQLGIGSYFGTIKSNTWHRVGIVVQASQNRMYFYIDGVQVGFRDATQGATAALDGRWSLSPASTAALFNDNDGEAASGYVNSIQLRDVALSKAQMAALSGPQAAGIPTTLPPIPSFVEEWIPNTPFARTSTDVGVVLNRGSSVISNFVLTVDAQTKSPTISTNGDLYTLRLASPGFTALSDHTVVVSFGDSAAGTKSFTNQFRVPILYEDFDLLVLGPPVDEQAVADVTNVWTKTTPSGWMIDDSRVPLTNVTTGDLVGVTEWRGWSFANKDWWVQVAGDQTRSQFSKGTGAVAIADPDEWDDLGNPDGTAGYMSTFLITAPISLQGVAPNTAFLRFDSSWRPEGFDDAGPDGQLTNNQTAVITVSYNGGAPMRVLKWDSQQGSPTLHPDSQNETVVIPLNNPAGATNVVINFGLTDAANDWWWAVDNISVDAGAAPPTISGQPATVEVTEGQSASLTVTATGDGLSYQWLKGQGMGKVPVPGATSATLNIAATKVSDAGYYSVEVKNPAGTAVSTTARLTVLPNLGGPISRLILLSEDFNGLTLGANVDEGINTPPITGPLTNVWTKTPPAGWSIDDTGVPGVGDPDQDGVTEWAGWSFANRDFWAAAGGQSRSAFTKATGAAAIADSDEWDDISHAAGNMATYLKTKSIPLQGVKANSVILKFDSSWNPEPPQKANITVAFDGGAAAEIYRYESEPDSPSFHPAELNETIALPINNPAGATNLMITFGYFDTLNNWWYAIDNLVVLGDRAPLFSEDFNSLVLGPSVDEGTPAVGGVSGTNVWTKTAPPGWSSDDTGVPGVGTDQDGVTEWAGWSFASRTWWAQTAGDQQRTGFTKGTGASAIADSDEWDDLKPHAAGNMATYLTTPSISIAGQTPNTLVLKFDSSWRDEDPQKANIRVSYDAATPVEVLRWESVAGPNFHDDNVNETVIVALNNPAGATSMKITFGYFDTLNNWWWAIDNIEVTIGSGAPPGLGELNFTVGGGNLNFTWSGGAGIRLQKATSLSQPDWTDVPGTDGANAKAETIGAGNAFYRLFKP